jgi:hypothetical protein
MRAALRIVKAWKNTYKNLKSCIGFLKMIFILTPGEGFDIGEQKPRRVHSRSRS